MSCFLVMVDMVDVGSVNEATKNFWLENLEDLPSLKRTCFRVWMVCTRVFVGSPKPLPGLVCQRVTQ